MKKIIIIGGGIAGLSAGIYAQKAGFESVIYEKHIISGGECTGWDRKGYHIDGCIHWLMGTKEGTKLNNLWKEVGALENIEIHQSESFAVAKYDDKTVVLHRDLDKLKSHLIEVSPEDAMEIEKLSEYIKAYYAFEPPIDKPIDLMNPIELIKFISSMRESGKVSKELGKISLLEYTKRFKSPAIREAFKSIIPETYSAYVLPFTLGTFVSGNGGRPKGGSLALAKRMEEKYKSLGGKIIFRKEAEEILVDGNNAKGVLFNDGTKEYADYIIPTTDINITFKKLLKDKYKNNKFEMKYKDNESYPLQQGVLVSLGVDADLSSYPEGYVFQTEGFRFENENMNMLSIKHYSYEPSFAPEGKSIIIVYFNANYDWWKEKYNNYDQYKAEKLRLAEDIIKGIEEHFPELTGKIETIDVSTPITNERYCGAYKGSYMSFGVTPKGKQYMHNGKIKGIKNLYLAGQWLMSSGGLPVAAVTGKWAIQRIAKKEKIKL